MEYGSILGPIHEDTKITEFSTDSPRNSLHPIRVGCALKNLSRLYMHNLCLFDLCLLSVTIKRSRAASTIFHRGTLPILYLALQLLAEPADKSDRQSDGQFILARQVCCQFQVLRSKTTCDIHLSLII